MCNLFKRLTAFLLIVAFIFEFAPVSNVHASEDADDIGLTGSEINMENYFEQYDFDDGDEVIGGGITSSDASEDAEDSYQDTSNYSIKNTLGNMRGVWVSFCDYKSMGLYNKSKTTFTKNADKMFKKFKKDKINTVFFHVCPCNDAIYPSKTLKWSSYMFKNSKKPAYDPLKILIERSHAYGIAFHAWLNPYRKSMTSSYNPGSESSTNRIVKIVKEIAKGYNVDGIHMDDYFYPNNGQFKGVSAKTKKTNVNKMVKKVYNTVKAINSKMIFGISPAGNVSYAKSIGCDLNTWLNKKGYIDYILPQIYWSDKYLLHGINYKMYTNTLKHWKRLDKSNKTMIIGLAIYRAGVGDSCDRGWTKKNNVIVTQIKQQKEAGCKGFVLFSSQYMYKKNGKKEMANYRKYMGIA